MLMFRKQAYDFVLSRNSPLEVLLILNAGIHIHLRYVPIISLRL